MILRRFYVLVLLVVLVAAAGSGVITGLIVSTNLHGVERKLCHRLNVHRNADNIDSYSAWKVNVLFASAIQHPPSGSLPQSPAQKALTAQFLALLQSDLGSQSWTPLTRNCSNPGQGNAPVLFIVRQPTTKDLRLQPGE